MSRKKPHVIFLLGLCGSGKSHMADRINADIKIDEDFLDSRSMHKGLISAIKKKKTIVITEIAYCVEKYRKEVCREILKVDSGAQIDWICFENDLFRANKNCKERSNKGPQEQVKAHMRINRNLSEKYTYPKGAIILRLWTKE
jgi:hypothetical protein